MRIGIDVGGTKLELVALDRDGCERSRRRIPTPRGDYDGTVAAIKSLHDEAVALLAGEDATVGLGIPGTLSPATGLVKNANSTWLNGRPFKADLEAALGRPVRIANDANCFALSEASDGAAAGAATVFGVILGTGVGGGIVVGGQVVTGANAVSGEWGHTPLPWPSGDDMPARACWCGRHGCIERYLSGPALETDYQQSSGTLYEAADVVRRAVDGDAGAEAVLSAYEDRLARGLAVVIDILDPDVIVLGGGLSNIGRLTEAVPRLWPRYVFSDRVTTALRPARHGDSSGARGAAWLWEEAAA